MVFSLQNDFTPGDSQLHALRRVQNPGSFQFKWYPDLVGEVGRIGRAGELGPTRDYWISGLAGRATAPGSSPRCVPVAPGPSASPRPSPSD